MYPIIFLTKKYAKEVLKEMKRVCKGKIFRGICLYNLIERVIYVLLKRNLDGKFLTVSIQIKGLRFF